MYFARNQCKVTTCRAQPRTDREASAHPFRSLNDTDLDLHRLTPSGTEIYFASSGESGFLDVDQCVSSCGEGSHGENIVFDSAPASGRYEIWVENYDGRRGKSFRLCCAGARGRLGTLPSRGRRWCPGLGLPWRCEGVRPLKLTYPMSAWEFS